MKSIFYGDHNYTHTYIYIYVMIFQAAEIENKPACRACLAKNSLDLKDLKCDFWLHLAIWGVPYMGVPQ